MELDKIKDALNNISQDKEKNDFINEQKEAELKFFESIKGFVSHEKYIDIFKCLEVVLNSKKIHSFILDGSFGLGKSTIIKGYLKQNNHKFVYLNSYSTALSLYLQVYHNKDKLILLDDLNGIWKDEKGLSILRALINTEDVRYITYNSSSEKLTAPSNFIFSGKIIILCNDIRNNLDETILSRVIYRNLRFNFAEKFDFIESIIKNNYNLQENQVKEILRFLKINLNECVINFNFRSLLKITEFYLKYPDEWRILSLKEIPKDEDMQLIKDLSLKNITIKAQIQEFITITGKSRRTYFNLKKKYNELKVS